MKTKLLLFALLMWLPWCAKAQDPETVCRVSLTDLPEEVNVYDLNVRMFINNKGYYQEMPLDYDQETSTFSVRYIHDAAQGKTNAKLLIQGINFLPTDSLDWVFDAQQQEQTTAVSMKSYKKVSFEVEDGWGFYEQTGENSYQTSGFEVSKVYPDGRQEWTQVGGAGMVTDNPEKQAYYVYAEPGEYYWQGKIKRVSDHLAVDVSRQLLTVSNEGKAMVQLDWEHNSLVTFKPKNMPTEISSFTIYLHHEEGDGMASEMTVTSGNNGTATAFLSSGYEYDWNCEMQSEAVNYFSKHGILIASDKNLTVDIDYADFEKHTVVLKGLQDDESCYGDASIYSTDDEKPGYVSCFFNQESRSQEICLPKGNYALECRLSVTDQNGVTYETLPKRGTLSVGSEKEVALDYSNYHKVKLQCMGESFSGEISKKDDLEEGYIYGSCVLLPDGNYHVSGYYDADAVRLEKDFTVSGSDLVVDMEYNPADYTALTVELDQLETLPEFVRSYYFNVTLYQNGQEVDYFNIGLDNGEYSETKRIKKGTYTYEAEIQTDGPDHLVIPFTGTLELNGEKASKVFDLSELCFVPLEVTDENQNQLEAVYVSVGDDIENSYYVEQPGAYMIAMPGTYDLTFFISKYATQEQKVVLSKQTEKLSVTMQSADVYLLMIYPDNMDEYTTATVTVEGVGSYQVRDDEYTGDMRPFMSVKSGTYKLTITAPGYETYTQMIEVSEATYSYEDDGVYFEIPMKKTGTSVENMEQGGKPEVSVAQNRICVKAQSDCRMMVYNMSGVCVASAQGMQMMTETLPSGIYIVKTASAAGTDVKKVAVGK